LAASRRVVVRQRDATVLASSATRSHAIRNSATVVLLGTLDTKGAEYAYLRDRVREHDVDALLIDAGILGEPLIEPDVTREEVALAAGVDLAELARARDRATALETMGRGAAVIVERLHSEGRMDGIAGLGGTGGSAVLAHAVRPLPVGFPKLIVSTVVAGDTRPYVGTTDVTLTYSVVDVAGMNSVLAEILANAAGAIAGMVKAQAPPLGEIRPRVSASMWGITTPCVTRARERLEELGYEVLVFHQTGVGGRSMEHLMTTGVITGSLDATLAELAGELLGGVWPAAPNRLEVAGRLGIPQVVAPGALDFVAMGPRDSVPERLRGHRIYQHSPAMVGIRTTPEECSELGRTIAIKLNAARGPTALFLPLCGISLVSTDGQPFHDPAADEALFGAFRKHVDRARVDLYELDVDINDPEFALAMANRLHEYHEAWKPA
jgi:uncharacterized protein (UPF0261 family)